MIDEIVKSTREASAVLDRIKSMPCEGLEKKVILPLLRKAVNLKLDSGGHPDRYQKACHYKHQTPGFAEGKSAG